MFVAAGCTAAHVVIGDAEGRCMVWGRNDVRHSAHTHTHTHTHPLPRPGCLPWPPPARRDSSARPRTRRRALAAAKAPAPSNLGARLPSPPAQKGQLGLGDTLNRYAPTVVEGLAGKHVSAGAQARRPRWCPGARGACIAPGWRRCGPLPGLRPCRAAGRSAGSR
jgi:hypothetical protein